MSTPAKWGPAKGAGHGGPARGPGQPPFERGNLQTVSHGARSPRVYGDLARQLAAGLLEDRDDLRRYPEAVASWATLEAQAALIRRHLAEVGPIDPTTGEPRPGVLGWLQRLEKAAESARARLGLDPRSEAALARERAAATVLANSADLDQLAERGRAALAAREAAGLPAPPDLAGEVLARQLGNYADERAAQIAAREAEAS